MFEIGDLTNSYIGFEDVRMTYVGDKYMYQGMIKDDKKGVFRIGVGEYDINHSKTSLEMDVFESPYNRRCEKNWALFEKENELYAIYEYNPLTIIKFDFDKKNVNIVSKDDKIPAIFKQLRGSSCGVKVSNKKDKSDEIWFVVHIVSAVPNNIRRYYHAIVILDYKTLKFKQMSNLFKFDKKQSIEYCLGIIVNDDEILMSYSIFDNSSYVGKYKRDDFCRKIELNY